MDENLQSQVTDNTARLDAFNASQTIPLKVDLAWQKRGFVKTSFFVAGQGTVAANGSYEQVIPGATQNAIPLATTFDGSAIGAQMIPAEGTTVFGSSTTQFNITHVSGNDYKYTWNGTGTNPNITALTIPKGSRIVIFSSNFNVANQNSSAVPWFDVINSGSGFFDVTNPAGVAESGKAIGTGSITGGPSNAYSIFVTGTATSLFSFVVFLFPSLFVTN